MQPAWPDRYWRTVWSLRPLAHRYKELVHWVRAIHRMENPGKVPMVLIEVQTGVYLGEDDIIRYEDIYARN
jgi:hypothetical protein